MRKIIAFLVLGHFIAFGQNVGSINNEQDKSYLPNITPPSPEAFAITEYGKNGITETTGKLNLSIPIYNYNAGNLNLPISLNYSGAGVKVNDISTWVGSNWNLSPGGVITRIVNDFADEDNTVIRKYINKNHLLENASNTCADFSQEYFFMSTYPDQYDTEVDVFNFSFDGYSGSFFLDENFNPIYQENENELKITILGNEATNQLKLLLTKTFCITTPNGVKYYFGGEATESTMMFSGHRGTSKLSSTSFNLFKIEHPANGTILFEYKQNVSGRLTNLFKVYNMKATTQTRNTEILPFTSTLMINQIYNPKILSKIKSLDNSIEINFDTTVWANRNFLSTLNNIKISTGATLLKQIDFTYDAKSSEEDVVNDFVNSTRFFLKNVEINKNLDSNGVKYEKYEMEYNAPFSLPNRLSNSQDILGFYNGIQNLTLIPDHPGFNAVNSPNYANRHPNFELASKGVLNKIIYPKRGYSIFEYESSDAKQKRYKVYEGSVEGISIANTPGNNGFLENSLFTPPYTDQEVIIDISTSFINQGDEIYGLAMYQANKNMRVELKITDLTANSAPTYFRRSLGMNPRITNHSYKFLKNHLYSIQMKFLNNTNNDLTANFKFTLFEGYDKVEGFGVRLKRQKDYAFNNSIPTNEKRYYYGLIDMSNLATERLPEISYAPKISYQTMFPTLATSTEISNLDVGINIHSDAAGKYANVSNGEFYDVVSTSFGGDNFENGGTEKFFLYIPNMAQEKVELENDGCALVLIDQTEQGGLPQGINCGLPSPINTGITILRNKYSSHETTNMGLYNGKLLGERNYRKSNGQLLKISETIYDYLMLEIPIKQTVNLICVNLFNNTIPLNYCTNDFSDAPRHAMSDCYFGYYEVNSYNFKLRNVISKNYIDPIPMSLYTPLVDSELNLSIVYNPETEALEAPYKKITTTQTYEYGTLKGLPTAITSSTSEDATVNKTVNTYVNTASTLPNIPSTQAALYTSLLAQNRVGEPVQVQQFVLSTQRTLFKNWTIGSTNKILPEKIQLSKGLQPLEDKALFYNYDTNFNPAVIGYAAAPKTKYIFNTDGLVVAKIENYTGTATSFTVITGNIDNTNCALQTQNPTASVTVFTYDLSTKKLLKITDSKCQNTFYVYDTLQRLQFIKDHDGNIVKEFDQQYKSQN